MNDSISVSERLIVAADFSPVPGGRVGVRSEVVQLANELGELGVVIKVNSVLRAWGYELIDELRDRGVRVCADLKLVDIPQTLKLDGEFLRESRPDFVTMMCNAEIDGMFALKDAVHPDTKILGVTVLTSLKEDLCRQVYKTPVKSGVLGFARNAKSAGLWGLVCAPMEAEFLSTRRELQGLNLCTPNIRYDWAEDKKDDQDKLRAASAGFAVTHGVTCVIVGRPILNAKLTEDRSKPQSHRQAAEWILQDIEDSLAKKAEIDQLNKFTSTWESLKKEIP
ncbi:MAG: orotidine 5'-phosphate decarboxylase [bacterium]|nr:orotidine 5'-phosphate decarboxylase [bacterium]